MRLILIRGRWSGGSLAWASRRAAWTRGAARSWLVVSLAAPVKSWASRSRLTMEALVLVLRVSGAQPVRAKVAAAAARIAVVAAVDLVKSIGLSFGFCGCLKLME